MNKSMESGIILLNKKPGITSFDALRDIKRALGTGKVGHTGTLDKFAQGLLIVLVGKALKLSRWFSHCDKKYEGRIHFGAETDTLDPEGTVIAEATPPSREKVEEVLSQFRGEIEQAPPVYSAIHVNGQRASNLARAGLKPEMKKRPVTIYKLELLSWEPPFADIFVHCSSGTYIRSLARDIALTAGSRAFLCKLVRTQVAGFKLGDRDLGLGNRINESKILIYPAPQPLIPILRPIDKSVISTLGLQCFAVTEEEAQIIYHGKPLDQILKDKPQFPSAAIFCGENLVAVVEKDGGKWKYACVMSNLS